MTTCIHYLLILLTYLNFSALIMARYEHNITIIQILLNFIIILFFISIPFKLDVTRKNKKIIYMALFIIFVMFVCYSNIISILRYLDSHLLPYRTFDSKNIYLLILRTINIIPMVCFLAGSWKIDNQQNNNIHKHIN